MKTDEGQGHRGVQFLSTSIDGVGEGRVGVETKDSKGNNRGDAVIDI
jgi:hypothetical protein